MLKLSDRQLRWRDIDDPQLMRWVIAHDAAFDEAHNYANPSSASHAGFVADKRVGDLGVWFARERRTRTALRHLERRARRHRCRSRSVNGISAEDGSCGHRCSRRAGHRGLHEATGHLGGMLVWGRSR